MPLKGKGFFTWMLHEVERGNPDQIVQIARQAKLTHVLVKIADGTNNFGFTGNTDHTKPVVQALHAAGIQVWGWHYVYGDEPIEEANIAISRAQDLAIDGYVVNAEVEYKHKPQAAKTYMDHLRAGLGTLPIALSSYRFPNFHPELPWVEFLEKCDINMPQVYWEQAHNAGEQLRQSKLQFDALPVVRPYVPTGSAYSTPPIWTPGIADFQDFLDTAAEMGLSAVNFFQWAYCRTHLPEVWDTIAAFEWTAAPPPPPPPPPAGAFPQGYLESIDAYAPERLAAMYAHDAVLTRNGQTFSGIDAIKQSYQTLFANIPENAKAAFTRSEPANGTFHIHWQVVKAGFSLRISDQISLDQGKIKEQTSKTE